MSTQVLEKYLSEKFSGVEFQSSIGPSIIRLEWELGVNSKATKISVQQSLLDLVKAGMTISIDNIMFATSYTEDRVQKAKDFILEEFYNLHYFNSPEIGGGFFDRETGEYSVEASHRYQWVLDNYDFNQKESSEISDVNSDKNKINIEAIKQKIITHTWSQVCWASNAFAGLGIPKSDLFSQLSVLLIMDLAGEFDPLKNKV